MPSVEESPRLHSERVLPDAAVDGALFRIDRAVSQRAERQTPRDLGDPEQGDAENLQAPVFSSRTSADSRRRGSRLRGDSTVALSLDVL